MKYVAAFDIGTTAVKGVLVSEQMQAVSSYSRTIKTIYDDGRKEQNPLDWYKAFCEISRKLLSEACSPEEIIGIIMSGQMQDLICIDANVMPVCNAILYSDGRASHEAEVITDAIGSHTIEKCTGNHFDGSLPFAKLLWLKNKRPELYNATHKVVISSKDYCIARLTGEYVTDVTSASTAGLMDIHSKEWNDGWVEKLGLDAGKLPKIKYAHEKVGGVSGKASAESGYTAGTPVYTGTGDAGATTLASGISKDGEFNINLGTSGWIACVSNDVLSRPGVFNLAAMTVDKYINVVPFLNAGGVHGWIARTLVPEDMLEKKYDYIDRLLEESRAGSGGLIFLPYIAGERFPVVDADVKGCYIGITPETTKSDMARACLEGVAFSIRQGLEAIGRQPVKMTLVGGGAKTKAWCQILSDVFGQDIYVSEDAEFLPSIAIAATVFAAEERKQNYEDTVATLFSRNCSVYRSNPASVKILDEQYRRFVDVYPHVRPLFKNKQTI